jgi:hypothetical protein
VRLTKSQQRHLALLLDRLIRETRDRLEAPGLADAADGVSLRVALQDLLREAEAAADRLDVRLQEPTGDVKRELSAWSSSWWSTVLDARPAALRAYGAVDERTAEVLAPIVDGLADRLRRVAWLTDDTDAAADAGADPNGAPRRE